jgi:hypothetical protein
MPKKLTKLFVLILAVPLISYRYVPDKITVSSYVSSYPANMDSFYSSFYMALSSDVSKPDYEVFKKALTGFFNLKAGNNIKNNLLTIIDFSLSSNQERMWILDMNKMQVVHFNLVAHGRSSGEEFASHFSNTPSSNQSSIGFYLTDGIYYGKHGMSLYLDGVEPDVNDNARARAIVMHGADYVSRDFIRNNGRLGRSFGCPSIPLEDHEKIISMLSGRSCIYIHYPDDKYQSNSRMFNTETALAGIYLYLSETPGIMDSYPEIRTIADNY